MNISFLKVVKMTLAVKYTAADSGFIRRGIEHSVAGQEPSEDSSTNSRKITFLLVGDVARRPV